MLGQERLEKIAGHVKEILALLGEDVNREGLRDTPMRVAKAYVEWFQGLYQSPPHITIFENKEDYQDLVIIRDIPFTSICEHHLIPFIGTATIAYRPDHCYMGLSKAARIVDWYARRPQVQERLGHQVARHLFNHLKPRGVLVRLEAEHFCMTTRGVKAHGTKTITTAVCGGIDKKEVLDQLQIR